MRLAARAICLMHAVARPLLPGPLVAQILSTCLVAAVRSAATTTCSVTTSSRVDGHRRVRAAGRQRGVRATPSTSLGTAGTSNLLCLAGGAAMGPLSHMLRLSTSPHTHGAYARLRGRRPWPAGPTRPLRYRRRACWSLAARACCRWGTTTTCISSTPRNSCGRRCGPRATDARASNTQARGWGIPPR